MPTPHKIKTLATFLAAFLGGIGAHRFYLQGFRDRFGWLHVATLPISLLAIAIWPEQPKLFTGCLFVVSILAGMLQALAVATYLEANGQARQRSPGRCRRSAGRWPR